MTLAAQFVAPETLAQLFPNIDRIKLFEAAPVMSGLLTAGIWSAFFAVCPVMFRVRFFVLNLLWYMDSYQTNWPFSFSRLLQTLDQMQQVLHTLSIAHFSIFGGLWL